MDVRVGLQRKLSAEKLMLLNWSVGEDSWVPLDCKMIKSVNPKGNHSWIFVGKTDAEAVVLLLWPSDAKSWLIGKDPDTRKDWGQEEKGMTEDEMVGWHHWLSGHKIEQALQNGERRGRLVWCSPWGLKDLDTTELLHNNKNKAETNTAL